MRTLLFGVLSAITTAAATVTVEASTLSTVFSPATPGTQPADGNGLSPELAALTQFGVPNGGSTIEEFDGEPNLGSIAFVQSGPYYVEGNRAYGFAGTGRSDITFTPGTVLAVELEVRGSNSADSAGPSSFTVPGNAAFDDSDVSLLIWSDLGVQSVTQDISNDGFQTVSLDVSALGFAGESITRISLINGSESSAVAANALALIGRLSVTLVPEPGGALLLGTLGTLASTIRRR